MLMVAHMGEGGVKICQKYANVVYGRPLLIRLQGNLFWDLCFRAFLTLLVFLLDKSIFDNLKQD